MTTSTKFSIGDIIQIDFDVLGGKLKQNKLYPLAFTEISQFDKNSIGQHVITRLSKGGNDINSYNLDGDYMLEEDEIKLIQDGKHIYYIYKRKSEVIEIFPVKDKESAEEYCKKHRDWDFIDGDKINTIQLDIYKRENKHIPFKIIENRI